MKKICFLLIVCSCFIACKKDATSSGLTGRWRWAESSGGIGNIVQTPASTGNNWKITFNADSSTYQSGNFLPTESGVYVSREEIVDGQPGKYLTITSSHTTQVYKYYFLSKNKLVLNDHDMSDGFTHIFVREY